MPAGRGQLFREQRRVWFWNWLERASNTSLNR
jgi:hypothetical protein